MCCLTSSSPALMFVSCWLSISIKLNSKEGCCRLGPCRKHLSDKLYSSKATALHARCACIQWAFTNNQPDKEHILATQQVAWSALSGSHTAGQYTAVFNTCMFELLQFYNVWLKADANANSVVHAHECAAAQFRMNMRGVDRQAFIYNQGACSSLRTYAA